MNIKSLLSVAASALLLVSCSGNGSDNTNDNTAMSAKADSLVYNFGQMKGAEYLRLAQRDTILSTGESKKEYLRGVKAGLDAVKAGKEAYNKGLIEGMQMAMNFNQFAEDFGISLSGKEFISGISDVIASDSMINTSESQAAFYRIMGEFNKDKEERDKAAAQAALKAAGEALNMKEISAKLWSNSDNAGVDAVKDGDKVTLDIQLSTLQGKAIDSTFPKEFTVGQRLSTNPLSEAIKTLRSGQTGTFLTTAQDLFGARAQQLGLKAADVIKLVVTPTVMTEKEEK